MKGFIEVRSVESADTILINVNHIVGAKPCKTNYGDGTKILNEGAFEFLVETIETYSEVKKRIANALKE